MLKTLTRNFSDIIKKARGRGRLTAKDIDEALAEIRAALLDADVALPVADEFLAAVKTAATGAHIDRNMNPGRAFAAIVQRQLAEVMGGEHAGLVLKKSPSVVLACGLQGAGKTTNLAKIAKYLKTRKKRAVLASVDVYRPAALRQLAALAETIGVPCLESKETTDAVARAADILKTARRRLADAVLMDTAGRTVLDDEMMNEIRALSSLLSPSETLFFVDAMQGQDAIATARKFHDAVGVSGIVLTKFDGDSRGGAALSARAVTGAPIKFVGVGEKPDDLQPFHPSRFASRILGMGDLESLAEQAAAAPSAVGALARTIRKPRDFDLNDQLAQMREIKKMGGIQSMADKMPAAIGDKMKNMEADAAKLGRMEAAICSMTSAERAHPEMIKASRKRRIAAGAGVEINLINQLLTQHEQARKMMKRFAKNPSGLARMMGAMLRG
ncbi:MAG: signal recognition particle protein [Gammaproteobacteria bacterium]